MQRHDLENTDNRRANIALVQLLILRESYKAQQTEKLV